MKLLMKKQRKVRTTAKKKEKRNLKFNKYILDLEAENRNLKALMQRAYQYIPKGSSLQREFEQKG